MILNILVAFLMFIPGVADAAARADSARVGMARAPAAARAPKATTKKPVGSTVKTTSASVSSVATTEDTSDSGDEDVVTQVATTEEDDVTTSASVSSADCRDAYRECMDNFCLLDESEGARCACSDNIEKSKPLIQEIQDIQAEADKLYTEGVERAQLGAKARFVFGESEAAKKSSSLSGISLADWLNSGGEDEDELDSDYDIGDALYSMAAEFCASELEACGSKAEMEEMLYQRQIVADCKSFNLYLADQKINANANKRTAESAVRKAKLEMLDTTDKYNRGECLLAYRGCIADKGGCGTNFENCLDADLLGRRANACENVLDQCMAVKKYVLEDWKAESEMILENAAKYADKYARQTCLARIQNCLEEGCSTSSNAMCLVDVNVAAGVCPVITECDEMIPGLKTVVNDKLGYLRLQFCQNDVDACLRDKCGENFNSPECLGKKPTEIAELCPQDMFPSCKTETQFELIVQAALLQMDYQMMQGCLNYFGEQLGKVCGTDMSCLPADSLVSGLTVDEIPDDSVAMIELRDKVKENSKVAVDDFFKQFEKDVTVTACQDTQQPTGSRRKSLGTSVFNSAKMLAEISAENRALRQLETKLAELSRQQDVEQAEKNCYTTYKVEKPKAIKEGEQNNTTYIRSVNFEPALRNCHVCRVQRVCEQGGESKGAAAMKGVAGGLSAGASMGTMVTPGWGTLIGGVVGAVGGGLAAGLTSEGIKEFCQEVESCEDINM